MSKNVKTYKVFTLIRFEIANWHYRWKTITHVMSYMQWCCNIILKLSIF